MYAELGGHAGQDAGREKRGEGEINFVWRDGERREEHKREGDQGKEERRKGRGGSEEGGCGGGEHTAVARGEGKKAVARACE